MINLSSSKTVSTEPDVLLSQNPTYPFDVLSLWPFLPISCVLENRTHQYHVAATLLFWIIIKCSRFPRDARDFVPSRSSLKSILALDASKCAYQLWCGRSFSVSEFHECYQTFSLVFSAQINFRYCKDRTIGDFKNRKTLGWCAAALTTQISTYDFLIFWPFLLKLILNLHAVASLLESHTLDRRYSVVQAFLSNVKLRCLQSWNLRLGWGCKSLVARIWTRGRCADFLDLSAEISIE